MINVKNIINSNLLDSTTNFLRFIIKIKEDDSVVKKKINFEDKQDLRDVFKKMFSEKGVSCLSKQDQIIVKGEKQFRRKKILGDEYDQEYHDVMYLKLTVTDEKGFEYDWKTPAKSLINEDPIICLIELDHHDELIIKSVESPSNCCSIT